MADQWHQYLIPWTNRADHDSMDDSATVQGEARVWHSTGLLAMEKFNAQNPDKYAVTYWTGVLDPTPKSYRVSLVKSTDGHNYPPVGNYWIRLGEHTYRNLSREEWSQLFDDSWNQYNQDMEWDCDSPRGLRYSVTV